MWRSGTKGVWPSSGPTRHVMGEQVDGLEARINTIPLYDGVAKVSAVGLDRGTTACYTTSQLVKCSGDCSTSEQFSSSFSLQSVQTIFETSSVSQCPIKKNSLQCIETPYGFCFLSAHAYSNNGLPNHKLHKP